MSVRRDLAHSKILVWFRRDLRLHDHAALAQACAQAQTVYPYFVFDTDILNALPRQDRRVEFIQASLVELDHLIQHHAANPQAGLLVGHGPAVSQVVAAAKQLGVQAVFANHDDEPAALRRDQQVLGQLADLGISFHTFKDHVLFERSEVLTQTGQPFAVFTPYKNAWLKRFEPSDASPHELPDGPLPFAPRPQGWPASVPTLAELGFESTNLRDLAIHAGPTGARMAWEDFKPRMRHYRETRDFPSVKGPSYLSVHLRFGTLSIRALVREAHAALAQHDEGASTWLSELIWRDFYHQILHHHPRVVERAFKPAYDAIQWEKGKAAEASFQRWCAGQTGYPLVDAAMRQLNQTGYMHNRLRMVTASFLVKDLGIDWRWGEAYFATHLNDFDLAANNGGWQWASSSGCDAQPYFRIFNPINQSEKFDPEGKFIRRYVPELNGLPTSALHAPWLAKPIDLQHAGLRLGHDYPEPMVDHAQAREKTLLRYAVVKSKAVG